MNDRSESKDLAATTQGRGTRLLGLLLSVLLAVTMLPVAGIQSAYADEPIERPATNGGDVALQGASGAGDATAAAAPVAEEREGGMLAAGGLLYTVADGGLALVGLDEGAVPEGALAVPAAVSVDGRDVAVVAVDLAEGSVAEGVTALSIPRSVENIKVDTLASAFPSLASVEVASGQGSTLPVAAGAAAMRATYSSFGGALLGQATVDVAKEDGAVEAVQCRELLWAPPAAVAVRLPVDCLSIAPGALADAENLETVVCFGDVQRIAIAERDAEGNVTQQGALTDEQLETVTVVFPDVTPAVPADTDDRVAVSMALNDGATQTDKRHAWIALGLPLERLSMGKPVGSLTETVAVGDDGAISKTDLELVSYPSMHPRATDVKHPDESGNIDMAESGLAFEMKSDMTLSVHWEGDPTATPAHLEIPAYVTINNVTYPVTEIAPEAFKGAVFLESITIPDGVTVVGEHIFDGCVVLSDVDLPPSLRPMGSIFDVDDDGAMVSSSLNSADVESADYANRFLGSDDTSSSASSPETYSFSTASVESDDYIIPYAAVEDTMVSIRTNTGSRVTTYIDIVPANGGTVSDSAYRPQFTNPEKFYGLRWYAPNVKTVSMYALNAAGDWYKMLDLKAKSGFDIVSVNVSDCRGIDPSTGEAYTSGYYTDVNVGVVREEATSSSALLTESKAATTYAPLGHTHDDRYFTEDEIETMLDSYITTTTLDGKGYITKAVNDLANYYTKAQADERYALSNDNATQSWVEGKGYLSSGDFGTISYSGLDGADMSVYPTSYRKGGMPALPAPVKEGFQFAGWSWARGSASGGSASVADAFAEAGAVTLTANWAEPATPEAKHFFTSESPLRHDDASATQTHVIKVRLSNVPGRLASVSFEGDDRTGLLRDTSGVRLFVGASEGALATGTELGWGGSTPSGWECELARLGDDSYGVYVGVSIPTAAIDEASIPVSYADGSYVASLVKMNYAFA